MFNPKELTRVTRANSRSTGVDYDLAYSEKTDKFRVSPEMYDEADVQNHGFTLVKDNTNKILYLAAEPNELAIMHKGRGSGTKGREFTASELRANLDNFGFEGVNEFDLEFVQTVEGVKYFRIHKSGEDTPRQPAVKEEPSEEPSDSGVPEFGEVGSPAQDTDEDPFGEVNKSEDSTPSTDHDDLDSLLG